MSLYEFSKKVSHFMFRIPSFFIKKSFKKCGPDCTITKGCTFSGCKNISLGKHVKFNSGCKIMSTRSEVIIGDYVLFGPNVVIVSGDHRFDIPDKPIALVGDNEKKPENDANIHICGDNWIGANVIILKGVTIGKGSIIGAGSVVTKSIPENSIAVGNPAKVIKKRFN